MVRNFYKFRTIGKMVTATNAYFLRMDKHGIMEAGSAGYEMQTKIFYYSYL